RYAGFFSPVICPGAGEFNCMKCAGRNDPHAGIAVACRKPAVGRRGPIAGAIAVVLSAALSACVGPNFVPPPAPDATGYLPGKLAPPSAARGGPHVAGQHFIPAAEVWARGWAAFQSEPLNALIRQSVEHNPSLQSAEAAIRVAQFNALAQRGAWSPQLTG